MRVHLTISLLAPCSIALGAPKPEVRKPEEVVIYRKTEQAELKLEIFRPAGWKAHDERPAIVFFFGGGWVGEEALAILEQGNPAGFPALCNPRPGTKPPFRKVIWFRFTVGEILCWVGCFVSVASIAVGVPSFFVLLNFISVINARVFLNLTSLDFFRKKSTSQIYC